MRWGGCLLLRRLALPALGAGQTYTRVAASGASGPTTLEENSTGFARFDVILAIVVRVPRARGQLNAAWRVCIPSGWHWPLLCTSDPLGMSIQSAHPATRIVR